MMNCKLDVAVSLIVDVDEDVEPGREHTASQQHQLKTSVYDESCPEHALPAKSHAVARSSALSKLKSCCTKLLLPISSKTKDLSDFETIILSSSVNKVK